MVLIVHSKIGTFIAINTCIAAIAMAGIVIDTVNTQSTILTGRAS